MKRINYKSDFNFILRLLDCRGDEVGFPDYDWVARFWTGVKANAYEVSCIGGVCKNCYNDDGTIHVVVDNHHLSPGILRMEFVAMLPDGIYPDGDERVVTPAPLDVELVRTAAPCPSSFEVEVILPYIKFRYEDLTEEQKAELMQPAVDAANHAAAVLKEAEMATEEAIKSNRELADNIEAAAEAETLRQRAEESRISSEESRQQAESLREDAEAKRTAAETTRVDAEADRVVSENARVTAEMERVKDEKARHETEDARVVAESNREEQEESRKEAEKLRASEETKRVNAESLRATAENARQTAEQNRVTSETERSEAEESRRTAESKRATEFASWETELDGKAEKNEVTQSLAGKQNKLTPTTDLHITEDNIIGLTEEFKNSKLDKAVWEERTKSFYIVGIIDLNTGDINPAASAWVATEFLPLNRNNPLIVDLRTNSESDQCGGIFFYDESKIFLKHICTPTCIQTEIDPSEIPSKAVYFRCNGVTAYNNNYSNGLTFEAREGAVSEAIAASKFALFIDLWNEACGSYGRYNPETGYFELNGLTDITYEEAIRIFEAGSFPNTGYAKGLFQEVNIRTNLPYTLLYSWHESWANKVYTALCFKNRHMEVASIASKNGGIFSISLQQPWETTFEGAKLRSIVGVFRCQSGIADASTVFGNLPMLEDMKFSLNGNGVTTINWAKCPKLTVDSINYTVQSKANLTFATTITVHPDIYAKLTGDTSNAAAAALTEEELAQWQQLLVDAAEKQITFATT